MDCAQIPIARKLSAYVGLTAHELSALSYLLRVRRIVTPGHNLLYEGQSGHVAFILNKGWVCSYKSLRDGSRQIVDFQIPGDFLGLRSLLLRTSDHNLQTITEIEVSEVSAADLLDAFGKAPRLATAVLWAASRDEAVVVEHLVDVGQRRALVRIAHFLLELGARLKFVGLGSSAGYNCPVSQYLLADALALSANHVNRVLRRLHEAKLLTFKKGMVAFNNLDGLKELTDFDIAYLDQTGPLLP